MDSQAMSELTDFNEDTLGNRHKLTGRVNMHSAPIKGCKKNCFKATTTTTRKNIFQNQQGCGPTDKY